MIRVHVCHCLTPRGETFEGVRYSRHELRRDESIRADRIDSMFACTPILRQHLSLDADARTVLRYDDQSSPFGHRLLVLSDSIDAVERAFARAMRGDDDDFDPNVPAYLPEDL